MNCTPVVRQYAILSNQRGCQFDLFQYRVLYVNSTVFRMYNNLFDRCRNDVGISLKQ